MLFLQIAEGVDDRTWGHLLNAGHYSEWFRDVIKDAELAQVAVEIEEDAESQCGRIPEAATDLFCPSREVLGTAAVGYQSFHGGRHSSSAPTTTRFRLNGWPPCSHDCMSA